MTHRPQPGLYRRLTLRLLLPMMVLVAAGGALGLHAARRQTDEVFDRWLLDEAVSLSQEVSSDASGVRVDLPHPSQVMLGYDEIDQTFFAVEQAGRPLVGVAGIPHGGSNEAIYANGSAFDGVIAGHPVRVAAARPACTACGDVTVLVAETRLKRERAQRGILWSFSPMVLLLFATMGAILMTVRRTVQPLEMLAQQWNRESHESLSPIPVGDLPRELSPFATALNDLLARIRNMLAREAQFAATAAHQLRTPLAGLRLGLDRARRAGDLAATRAVLDELEVSTDHTARMVQQLLLLGRLDPEHDTSVDLRATVLADVVRDVCALFSESAFARDIDLELSVPEAPVIVQAQSELLAEAVANLIDNALKATPPRGHVRLTVQDGPPRLRVCDTGQGIPAAQREHVFERFSRGAGTTWAGSGLGLAIVREIASLHRARVSIGDAEDGHGTCVTMTFGAPATRAAA